MTQDESVARFAVVSRIVVLAAGFLLAAGAVWAFLAGNVALGIILIVVTGLLVLARGFWTVRRGFRAAAERERARVPATAGGTPSAPTPVERLVPDLVGMNSDGLPYLITTTRTADGVRVEVRWKVEEMRWATLFVRGKQAYAWRMEVDLDPATGHYAFTEYSASTSVRAAVSPGGAFVHADWTWTRGKTAGKISASSAEGADGQVMVRGADSSRTSWEGAVMIRPADAKIPVFTVLRDHGWRPRFDWFGARLFEK